MQDRCDKDKFVDPIYEPLRVDEQDWLTSSRAWVTSLAKTVGEQVYWTGSSSDWNLVQRLVDEDAFDKTHQGNWEGLAVICGDVLANKLGLSWKRVTDGYGTTVALQYPGSAITVYACNILWKRAQRNEEVDVSYLFGETEKSVRQMIESGDYKRVFDKQ